MTSIMRRECGGRRLQAPRHLLEDLCSTNDARYAIDSGRDFGSPPFSLDFAQSKHAGILVLSPQPAALPSTSMVPRRVSARPRRRKASSRQERLLPFAARSDARRAPAAAACLGERARMPSHAFNVRGCFLGLLLFMQAVADEEGYISLINTSMPKQENGSHIFSWMCHRNAIFDVAFCGECFSCASCPQFSRDYRVRHGLNRHLVRETAPVLVNACYAPKVHGRAAAGRRLLSAAPKCMPRC